MENNSARFSLNAVDIWKATRGLLVVLAGAGLTYLSEIYLQIDWGNYAPIATAVIGTLIELGRRWLSNYK